MNSFAARNLLFHRGDVDDFVGTYVTDYVLAFVCFLNFLTLVFFTKKFKKLDNEIWVNGHPAEETPSRILPWNWTGTPITMANFMTYSNMSFQLSFAIMGISAGLTHQYLQEVEPFNSWDDTRAWLITWRIGCIEVAFCVLAILTMSEQMLVQEGNINIPKKGRICYYATVWCIFICIIVVVIVRSFDDYNPFEITALFTSFAFAMLIQFICCVICLVRRYCQRWSFKRVPKNTFYQCVTITTTRNNKKVYLWLFTLASSIPLFAMINSAILTPKCSLDEEHYENCPFPAHFNHNAVMHTMFCIGYTLMSFAEIQALLLRQSAIKDSVITQV